MGGKWRHDDGKKAGVVIEAIVKSEVAFAFGGAAFPQGEKAGEVGVGGERGGVQKKRKVLSAGC